MPRPNGYRPVPLHRVRVVTSLEALRLAAIVPPVEYWDADPPQPRDPDLVGSWDADAIIEHYRRQFAGEDTCLACAHGFDSHDWLNRGRISHGETPTAPCHATLPRMADEPTLGCDCPNFRPMVFYCAVCGELADTPREAIECCICPFCGHPDRIHNGGRDKDTCTSPFCPCEVLVLAASVTEILE